MLDVRCSMFFFSVRPWQKHLSSYGAMEGGLSLGEKRIADYLTSNNYYSFTSPCLMKYESLIQRFSGNYMRLSENGYFPQFLRPR